MKKLILLYLILFIALSANSQRKKVGLVLSGGGAKGVAHIGVLKVLEEAGIPIDYIAGTSMGALVGALYAIGYDAHELDSMVRIQDWSYLLSDKVLRYNMPFSEKEETEKYLISIPVSNNRKIKIPSGFISGQNIYNLFSDLTIGYQDSIDFDKLPIPFKCVAANMVDGQEYVFERGSLPLAMRASMAIPGVFAPVMKEGMVLVDGGIANNFPVDIALDMGADIIIGIDVQAELKDASGLESVTGIIDQMTSFLGIQKYEENRKLVDLYIKPDVTPYTAGSFSDDAIETLLIRGEEIARDQWDEIVTLKKMIGLSDDYVYEKYDSYINDYDTIKISKVHILGIDEKDEKWIRRKIRVKDFSEITLNDLHMVIDDIYGIGVFSNVSYKLSGGPVYELELTLHEKPTSSINLGFRFDSEEMAAILLNTTFSSRKNLKGSRISLTGRLSMNPYIKLDYYLGNTFMRRFNVSYMFKYNDLDVYSKGKKSDNITYTYHRADLGLSDIYFRNAKFQIGLKYEYFNYDSFLFSDVDRIIRVKPEGFFSYFATIQWETFDKRYFPTRGHSVKADYNFYTDNFVTYDGGTPFSSVSLWYKSVVSLTNRVKMLPSIYGRVLIGHDIPYPYLNTMGGTNAARYIDQQIPFIGIQKLEFFENSLLQARLDFRYRLGKNHYITINGNFAKQESNFFDILGGGDIWGGGAGYSYNSIIGPVDFLFSLSDWSKKLGFYFNLGFNF